MRHRYISFLTQISLICAGIVVLPFIGITLFFALNMSQKADEEYRTVLEKSNTAMEAGISSVLLEVERMSYLHVVNDRLAESLRHRHEVYDKSFLEDNRVVTDIIREAVLLNPNIFSVVMMNDAGNIYDNNVGGYYWRNLYQDLSKFGETAENMPGRRYVQIQYQENNQPEAVLVVKPMVDIERNEKLGTIGIIVGFRTIREVLNNGVQNHGCLIVYNESGDPVYSHASPGTRREESETASKIWKQLSLFNPKKRDQKSYVKDFSIGKHTYIAGVQCLDQMGWIVVNYTNRNSVRALYHQNLFLFVAIAGLMVVFDLVVASIFVRRLNRSVHGLCQAMENSGGQGIPETLYPERTEFKTEIDMLIHSYNNVISRLKQSMERAFELQMNEQRMEFRMLQAQINPHFLYNAFNLISSIAGMNGVDSICKITGCISEMFRYSIQENLVVKLKDELREVNNYMTIQTIRFKDHLYADFDVDEETLETPVPVFLLQPLVENAIIHGLEPKEEVGVISIIAYMLDEEVELIVRDNGVGISPEELSKLQKSMKGDRIEPISTHGHASIGIKNVNQRIKAYYGENYGLRIESTPLKGTSIHIRIPQNITKIV